MGLHKNLALKYLQDICDALENDWDCDYTEGALLIKHPKGQILLNYHGVMDQIWLSSFLTGAHHFSYKLDQWLCTRSGKELEEVLRQDLNA